MIPFLAQAESASEGVSYGLLLSVIAVEATLSVLTWAGFNAESRAENAHDSDIRDAEAGYGIGSVVPAVAHLIEGVLAVRRPNEPIQAALDRADTSEALKGVVRAAAASSSPREIEGRLVRAWTVTGGATLAVQAAGPVLLFDEIANDDVFSDTVQVIAGVLLSGALAVLFAGLIAVRQLTRSLSRAIRRGKDAARGA